MARVRLRPYKHFISAITIINQILIFSALVYLVSSDQLDNLNHRHGFRKLIRNPRQVLRRIGSVSSSVESSFGTGSGSASVEDLAVPLDNGTIIHTKRRKIIRRKKLKNPPGGNLTQITTIITTIEPVTVPMTTREKPYVPEVPKETTTLSATISSFNTEKPELARETTTQIVTKPEVPETTERARISSFKTYPKKRAHNHHKVPGVWKIPYLNDEINLQKNSQQDKQIGKRESGELFTKNQNQTDLHTEESTNPYINSSTPISNELQNSLQFTLQMLHPLLNSDSVLSDKSDKIPENKTVSLTHSLSESVAQTPIAHDLGFLPTHLKKKHPLLNHDSIFGENSASKTGIRNSFDVDPPSRPKESNHFVETPGITSGTTTSSPSPTTIVTSSSKPLQTITSVPVTVTSGSTIQIYTTSSSTSSTTTKSTSSSTAGTSSTTSKSPSSSTPSSPSTSTYATTKVNPGILGVLNITEVKSKKPFETSSSENAVTELDKFPPVIMFPLDEDTLPKPPKVTTQVTSTTTTEIPFTSGEVSSAEQLLIEELLGLRVPAPNSNPKPSPNAPTSSNEFQHVTVPVPTESAQDSNEQLLQLFNLIQSQESHSQNKRNNNPNLPSDLNASQLPPTHSSPSDPNSSQEGLQNLLQALLGSSETGGGNSGQFDLAALLNSATKSKNPLTTILPAPKPPLQNQNQKYALPPARHPPTSGTPRPTSGPVSSSTSTFLPSSSSDSLSDADLKSIFALLDIQTSSVPLTTPTTTRTTSTTTTTTPKPTTTTITTTTKPTTITTTVRPTYTTTVTTTTQRPIPIVTSVPTVGLPLPQLTTTLHPALQSMLDLFTNQLKPFQSIPKTQNIPQTPPLPPAPVFTTPSTTTTTTTPVPFLSSFSSSTANSLDILSQLLNIGNLGGLNKVNAVRSTPPSPPQLSLANLFGNVLNQNQVQRATPAPTTFSLANLFGTPNINTNANIFPSSLPRQPNLNLNQNPSPSAPQVPESSAPSESNQLLNFFGTGNQHPVQQSTTPTPSGLYYWLDMNAFLGGDLKADPMTGIRPKIGNKYPFIKVNR